MNTMRYPILSRHNEALRITLIYAVISIIWIFFSDLLLVVFRGTGLVTVISISKGIFFVIVTASLLYVLVNSTVARILRTETRAQFIFDSVNDPIFLLSISKDGLLQNYIDVNDAAVQKLGYSRRELLELPPFGLVRSDQRDQVRESVRNIEDNGRLIIEAVYIAKDGREIPMEISIRIVNIGEEKIGISVARDITERKKAEEERKALENEKRRFYKETILAVTEGKFSLFEPEEITSELREPEYVKEITSAAELSEVRRGLIEFFIDRGLSRDSAAEFEFAVGEALANAIKHVGAAKVEAGRSGVSVWVAVIDKGKGIDTFAIPKVALVKGYTTKASMGLGYTMIIEFSDKVKLATSSKGTTVILEKRLQPLSDVEKRIQIHGGIT
jgi:PAS domain S-box-containing protein